MNQFVTTYQKDYPWPETRVKRQTAALNEADSCRCTGTPREVKHLDHCGDEFDWNRIAPMGRLLDPKLYSTKDGTSSDSKEKKFDQASTYAKKLEEQHPNLHRIQRESPMDEAISRINQDRLKTTYQLDFSAKGKMIAPETEQKVNSDAGVCVSSKVESECRTRSRRKDGSKKSTVKGNTKTKSEPQDDLQETRLPPWKSEYQDSIGRLGQAIMKTKILHRKKLTAA